ncbi:MAG: formate dehydrogenase subunit gamma [Gammaproteobacteria bacterium]
MANEIRRFTASDRLNHWLVVIAFFLAALSGLAFFHPALFGLTGLFGGGPQTRVLHPYFGVAVAVLFLGMLLRFGRHNLINKNDRAWLCGIKDVLGNREENVPPAGRFNAGQKLVFWLTFLSILTSLLTGIVFWRTYFEGRFSIETIRIATLLHSVAAVVFLVVIIIHIYAGIWVKGTVRGMTLGTVARNWARKHHLLWFREVTKS